MGVISAGGGGKKTVIKKQFHNKKTSLKTFCFYTPAIPA